VSRIRVAVTHCHSTSDYQRSVDAAGAEPFLIKCNESSAAGLLEGVDALLLTGGGDVDPELFGEVPHPAFRPAEPGRDATEIALVLQALADGLPILAICRGVQVLNVALGGSLVQDIPTQCPDPLNHRVATSPAAVAHEVAVSGGSHLATLLGVSAAGGRIGVNSRHHQAPSRLGEGLVVTGVADDGVIESLELREHAFCIGVQWHPENFVATGEFQALFDGLVAAALRNRDRD
jgi:putative glutamine amidotransferase